MVWDGSVLGAGWPVVRENDLRWWPVLRLNVDHDRFVAARSVLEIDTISGLVVAMQQMPRDLSNDRGDRSSDVQVFLCVAHGDDGLRPHSGAAQASQSRSPRHLGVASFAVVTLAEDLFLLAIDDDTGRPLIPVTHLDLGLGGALLYDLALQGRVACIDDHVVVTDPTPTGDLLLDKALAIIAGGPKQHEPEYWVRHLAKKARAAVQERLVNAGVLQLEQHRVFGLIPVRRAHQVDDRIEHELVDRLCEAVVLGHQPSQETAALASLALAIGLERHLFPRSDRRAVRQRMAEIAARSLGRRRGAARCWGGRRRPWDRASRSKPCRTAESDVSPRGGREVGALQQQGDKQAGDEAPKRRADVQELARR